MFGRRGAEYFVSDEGEILTLRELVKPIVHGINDGAHAELFVPQHFAHILLPELDRRIRIAPCELQVERNETITRISGEQDDLRPVKLASRDEIFAANSVPPIAFGAMFKQIMRKDNPRKTGQIIASRSQRELKAEASAKVSAKKCPKPCAATLRDGENDGVTA
jgi:hypothetical protein